MIITNAIQILNENRGDNTILDYHNECKENDPTYFQWLFGSEADNIGDYGVGMTADQQEEMELFDNSISSLQEFRDTYVA